MEGEKISKLIRQEQRNYKLLFGCDPSTVTLPVSYRKELIKWGNSLCFPEVDPETPAEMLKLFGMDVVFSAAQQCVACSGRIEL